MAGRKERIAEQVYGFWEAEGRRHGNDWAHWFRAEAETPLRVTFDTNALEKVARPERFPKDPEQPIYYKLHEALRTGRIRGYFSETLITLEGIQNKDRPQVLGSTRLESHTSSTGPNNITLNFTVKQDRKPLHPEISRRVNAALEVGMRGLRAPPRVGSTRVLDDEGRLFESDSVAMDLSGRVDRVVLIANAISARRVGFAIAQALGLKFSARDDAHELWQQGLSRTMDIHEERQVERAVGEWADGDSIASHYGYELDLFCTGDCGKSAGGPSVLNPSNRKWLSEEYGVQFVTLADLAAMVTG